MRQSQKNSDSGYNHKHSRADLHVHSKYSDRPSEWFLRRIGAPECFVEPLAVYNSALAAGMDYVTITDHNSIDGALEIAHLPGTFLSSEITTYFPENNCKIHCLVFDINEAQFQEIQICRQNIYELRDYLQENGILHSVSHPLFSVNDRLTVELFEKLLLLFNRFEGLNGTRHPRASNLADLIFTNLNSDMIAELTDKHGIEPVGSEAWKKYFTGGSDDHSGIYVASAHTVTPRADSLPQFIHFIRQNYHNMSGSSGTSLKLAHSFYQIAYSYYKSRFMENGSSKTNLLGSFLQKIVDNNVDKPQSVRGTLRSWAGKAAWRWKKRNLSDIEQMLVEECRDLFDKSPKQNLLGSERSRDRESFYLACQVSQQIGFAFFQKFVNYLQQGYLLESLQTFVSLGPVALGIAPYIAAFSTQHKDEKMLQDIAGRFRIAEGLRKRSQRVVWLLDGFSQEDSTGRMIIDIAKAAATELVDLTVITCQQEKAQVPGVQLVNFTPVGVAELEEYGASKLVFPPFLEILEFLERGNFGEIFVSAPGPLGLAGIAAGRLLELKMNGICHTDYPRAVAAHTEDEAVEQLTLRYVQWFYGQMDSVWTLSNDFRTSLMHDCCTLTNVRRLPVGVDCELFNPARRNPHLWQSVGDTPFVYLYIGRLTKDSGIYKLMEAFERLRKEEKNTKLVLMLNDDDAAQLRGRYRRDPSIVVKPPCTGLSLAETYASADILVLPAPMDYEAVNVLEAQASGVCAIMPESQNAESKLGRFSDAFYFDPEAPDALLEIMKLAKNDAVLRLELQKKAVQMAADSKWQRTARILFCDSNEEKKAVSNRGSDILLEEVVS